MTALVGLAPSGRAVLRVFVSETIAHPTVGGPSSSGGRPEYFAFPASPRDGQPCQFVNHNTGQLHLHMVVQWGHDRYVHGGHTDAPRCSGTGRSLGSGPRLQTYYGTVHTESWLWRPVGSQTTGNEVRTCHMVPILLEMVKAGETET